MSRVVQPPDCSQPDLIDRIADSLPAEVRADYYREMRHCRSLPENDEMLRILRAMQFLTLITVQVPERLMAEREKLDHRLNQMIASMEKWLAASEVYQQNLDERLAQLPAAIADGISPQAIAGKINENLRQQFVQSTIPQTAEALTVVAKELRKTTADFAGAAKSLVNQYTGAAEEARQAIQKIESTVSSATATANRAASDLSQTFLQGRRWAMITAAAAALGAGLLLGATLDSRFGRPSQTHQNEVGITTTQEAPKQPLKKTPEGTRAHDPRHVGR